ncbi:MAG: hypothetical protein AUK44_03390 [Porphyromonadaceae bacterium CG2_30_38_12]|nr:MAG: hypothetical protein AUK44_03390 [Porphyromonadaceae bacterium CG2_30_38_12]
MKASINKENKTQLPQKPNRLKAYIQKHWFVFALIGIIIILTIGSYIQIKIHESKSALEKQLLITDYEQRMDSLQSANLELVSRVFAWSIRSEMMRQNLDQVNQYFSAFVQQTGIVKVQLINAANGKVLVSSDKKDEGNLILNPVILGANKTLGLDGNGFRSIVNPIMGLESKIGILVIEYRGITHK